MLLICLSLIFGSQKEGDLPLPKSEARVVSPSGLTTEALDHLRPDPRSNPKEFDNWVENQNRALDLRAFNQRRDKMKSLLMELSIGSIFALQNEFDFGGEALREVLNTTIMEILRKHYDAAGEELPDNSLYPAVPPLEEDNLDELQGK